MKQLLGIFLSICAAGLAWTQPRVVENGKAPEKAYDLIFSEDLRFGAVEDEDVYFWALDTVRLSVNGDGHMFVADTRERRILEFDEDGKFVRRIAQQGKGPGEFTYLLDFVILKDGGGLGLNLFGGGLPSLVYFDKNMKFERVASIEKPRIVMQSGIVSPTGKFIAGGFQTPNPKTGSAVMKAGVIDDQFNIVMEDMAVEKPVPDPKKMADPAYRVKFLAEFFQVYFQANGAYAFDGDGHLFAALNKNYEIAKWSPDLKQKKLIIKRDYDPIPNTEKDIEGLVDSITQRMSGGAGAQSPFNRQIISRAVDLANPPKAKPPVLGLVAMEEGGLLVVRSVDWETGSSRADIFSNEGKYLGQVQMDKFAFVSLGYLPRMQFRNGFAYTIETDDYGENQVVRYTYRLEPK